MTRGKSGGTAERVRKQMGRVLVVNMGGTSTKLAIFSGDAVLHEENLTFSPPPGIKRITDELPAREEQVRSFLRVIGAKLNKFAAVIGRGGLLAPLAAGGPKSPEKLSQTDDPRPRRASSSKADRSLLPAGVRALMKWKR